MHKINELYHHGVPGQKWGVRKTKEKSTSNINSKEKSSNIEDEKPEEQSLFSKKITEYRDSIKKEMNARKKIKRTASVVSDILVPADISEGGIAKMTVKSISEKYIKRIQKISEKVKSISD